jgi:transposase
MKKINEEIISSIKELYTNGDTSKQISNILNISIGTVDKYIKLLGISGRNRKYKLNENYFEKIDSNKKSYLLGYLFSDGNVRYKNGTNYLKFKIHEKDKHILEFLKNELECDYPINNENATNCFYLKLNSKKLVEDLIKLGCVPNKSLILKYPNIEKKYYNSFIHGYFDGDGCIYYTEKKNQKSAQRQFKLLGTNEFLNSIKQYFNENSIETYEIQKYPKSNIYQLRTCNKKSLNKIYSYFYSDANYTFLYRKKDIFEKTII